MPDLTRLNDAVRQAREEQYAPSPDDEGVHQITPLSHIVEQHDGKVFWRTIAQLRQHAPEIYALRARRGARTSRQTDLVARGATQGAYELQPRRSADRPRR